MNSTYETSSKSSIDACAISPCGNYFAFNSTPCTLKIISLARIRYKTLNKNEINLNETLSCLWEYRLSSQIRCLDFGQGNVNQNRLPHRSNKRRINYHDMYNACILAVGLKSGVIKIYSLIPSNIFDESLPLIENNGNAKIVLHDHYDDICTVSFSFDGSLRLASASIDGKMRLWDMWDDGNMYQLITFPNFKPLCCTWGNKNRHICIVGAMGKGYVYQSEKPCVQIATLNSGHFNNISACRYSSDDSLMATCSFDTSVLIWCSVTYTHLLQIWHTGSKPSKIFMGDQHTFNIRDIQLSPDCLHLVSVSDDNFIRLWNLDETENPVNNVKVSFSGRKLIMNCLRILPDGSKYIIGTNDGRLIFIDGLQESASLANQCRKSIRKLLVNKLYSILSPNLQNKSFCYMDMLKTQLISDLEMHYFQSDLRRSSLSQIFEFKRLTANISLNVFIDNLPIPRKLKSYLQYGLNSSKVVENFEPRPLEGHFKGRNMSIY